MVQSMLYDLVVNDRFYFTDDKRRIIWQLLQIEDYESTDFFNRPVMKRKYHLTNDAKVKKEMKLNNKVTFLRNSDM